MENSRISAIKKSASITATVLKVCRIIVMVGAIITLVGGVICLFNMNSLDGNVIYDGGSFRILSPVDAEGMIVAGEGFDFLNGLGIENFMVWAALNCFVGAALLLVIMVVLMLIEKVFVELRDSDTPFTESIRGRLRIAGILITILVLTESIGMAVIVALSFWCLYCIFGYGMELQRHEDETL